MPATTIFMLFTVILTYLSLQRETPTLKLPPAEVLFETDNVAQAFMLFCVTRSAGDLWVVAWIV